MGYDLYNKNKDFYANIFVFPKLLQLAYLFGWKPRGTEPPTVDMGGNVVMDSSDWDGCYLGNGFQYVTKEDAEEIAVSLQKALQYIPDTDFVPRESINKPRKVALEEEVEVETEAEAEVVAVAKVAKAVKGGIFSDSTVFNQITEEEKDQLLSEFIGNKDYLKEFIDFCEDGEFCIS
ncbi:MAG: hypothetical protein V3U54_02950 [Thermodesulfobacteriota bacterium]